MNNNYSQYDAFICYETTTGLNLARHLKESLSKIPIKSFVAKDDIPPGTNEKDFRFKVIQEAKYFIIIITNMTSRSTEVQNEIDYTITLEKQFIICVDYHVKEDLIERHFKSISGKQRIEPFSDECDLARKVSDWLLNPLLHEKSNQFEISTNIYTKNDKSLIVQPQWSIPYITNSNKNGHIIFKLSNKSDKKIFIHGYRMFRVTPEGKKDVYYHAKICDANELKHWISDPHLKIILWQNDEHIFHWNDVNIENTYGFDFKGNWKTELHIAFIEQDQKELLIAIGETSIQYI